MMSSCELSSWFSLSLFLFLSLPVKEFREFFLHASYCTSLSTSTALLPSLFIDIEALHGIQRLELEALKKLPTDVDVHQIQPKTKLLFENKVGSH